jgi:hypothetical protein
MRLAVCLVGLFVPLAHCDIATAEIFIKIAHPGALCGLVGHGLCSLIRLDCGYVDDMDLSRAEC